MFNSFHLEGVDAFNKHDYENAKILFLQAINQNPEVAESYLLLGKAYFFCNEKSLAISHLKKYIAFDQHGTDSGANVPYAYDLLGQCYEANQYIDEAIKCYTTATKMNSSAASAWHNLGLLYTKLAQHTLEQDVDYSVKLFQTAQQFLSKSLMIAKDNPMFLHSFASWHEKYIEVLKKFPEEEAIHKEIDNNFNLAILNYQSALNACHKEDVALKNIISSNLTECFAQCGHYSYKRKNYENAQKFYSATLKLDPNHLVAINQMGMSFFKQNKYVAAREYFSSILEKTLDKQELADAWLNIACTYRLQKDWIKAEEALKNAKALAPEDTYIADEEQSLKDAKSQAILITAPQVMFSNANPGNKNSEDSPSQETTAMASYYHDFPS